MNKFNWTKAIGFGVLIWGVMAVALWILGSFQSLSPLWAHGIVAVIGGAGALLFASGTRSDAGSQAAEYGLAWAIIAVVLDLVATQWFDVHIFTAWQYWLGIALVLVAPWVAYELEGSGSHQKAI